MRTRIWLAAGAVAAAVLTGCTTTGTSSGGSGEGKASAAAQAPAENSAKKDVEIVRHGFEDHDTWGKHAYVTHYAITNHAKKARSYFVQLEFLDKDGDVLGTTGVTADKLGPGKTNTGDSAPLEAEITNGKIADIKGVRVSQVELTDPL
ncbi:hypothetical protein [Streptomyces sp. NPDC086782]|uniref:hypothetical protein n=1 Tax=Streptomyces sp. NPDC086782 TaxID=3365757 RepID=UPI0038066676